MAPHSSTFAQKIPWTEEPGRLQSMGSLESDTTEATQQQHTPVFLPGEFHGQRSLADYSPFGCKESDRTERRTHTSKETEQVGLKLNIQKTKIMASCPITSWETDGETVETVSDFILRGSKITADSDCSHEIKRRLLLRRKVMTNLDSIFGGGNGTPLQYFYLENPIDRGAWWAGVHGVARVRHN